MSFEEYQRRRKRKKQQQNQTDNQRDSLFSRKGVFETEEPSGRKLTPPQIPNLPPGNIFDFGRHQAKEATQVASLDPGWGAGFDENYIETQEQIIQGIQDIFPEFANIALDFVPLVGDIKGIAEAITGKDITGGDLAVWERALGAVPFFGGILKKVDAGKKVKAFIKLPGVWVVVENAGTKFDELIEYLASKLPSWKQRTRFAMAGEGGFEAPTEVASSMMNAMTGANAGVTFLNKYRDSFNLKLWGKAEGTIINFLKRSGLTDELKEEVVQTLLKIQDGIISKKLDIEDSGLAASFQDVVGRLGASEINTVEENLAELQRAVQVIEAGDVDGVVAISVRKGHKPKDLPEIDLDKVEADTYYRTTDGVIHLNEVKNTPNAFVSKLKEGAKKKDGGQFGRYRDWMKEGEKINQGRQATVYIKKSKPNFHRIIDVGTLEALETSLAEENIAQTILQVKDVKFTFEELQDLTTDAYEMLKKIKKETKMSFGEIADKYFDSMEKTFETLGKTYGH